MNRLMFLLMILFVAPAVWAEDPPPAEPASAEAPAPAPSTASEPEPTPTPAQVRRARGGPREKEAEGTEAPNRFKADIIQSEYRDPNGRPYEVDPE